MATNYPTSLDSYTTKVDNTDDVLAAHINDPQDAIEALEAKVGIDGSEDTDSLDYFKNTPASGTDINTGTDDAKFVTSKAVADSKLNDFIRGDGWITVSGTWAYASATTITVPSGAASLYQKGDKIKLTQTTAKYFYIVAVADTLLTVTGGSDYTVANAAITSPFFSKSENPQGFPSYFTYTPSTQTGWASFTENITIFRVVGRYCLVSFSIAGTSNSASAEFSTPITPFTTGNINNVSEGACGLVGDNGAFNAGASRLFVSSTSLIRIADGVMNSVGGFTTSGDKTVRGQIGYYF